MGDGRRRSLRRRHTGVGGGRTESRLSLVGSRNSGSTHVGRALLVCETELQAVGTAGRSTAVGNISRGTAGGDGYRGLARVIAGSWSSGSPIDDGNARSGRLVLHGFSVH